MSAAKPGRDPRSDRDPEAVCESDPCTGGPNRLRPGSRRRSRTLAAPPTRATNDRPCPLAVHLEGRNSVQPPSYSADQRPSAAEPHRRNCPRADQTGQRLACEKFLGTTNTVLCYRLTLKEASFVAANRSSQHVCNRGGFFCLQISSPSRIMRASRRHRGSVELQ